MNNLTEKKKHEGDIYFDWTDSNTLIKDSAGNDVPAGTCILLMPSNEILFLSPYTVEQLHEFKATVSKAIDHELEKRNPSKIILV